MKKHLLTTTAAGGLAALMAVPAAAQDSSFDLSGFARAGATYNDTDETVEGLTRIQLTAGFEIVADAGLTFGGQVRMRSNQDDDNQGFNSPMVYMSTGDFTLSAGNINGAVASVPSLFGTAGLNGNSSHGTVSYFDGYATQGRFTMTEYSSDGNGAADADGVQADYAMGPMSITVFNTDDVTGAGVGYSEGALSIGVAGEVRDDDDTLIAAGMTYNFGALTVGTALGQYDDDAEGEATKFNVTFSYDVDGAYTVSGYASNEDNDAAAAGNPDGESYGLTLSRPLGGGVTAVAGWSQSPAEVNTISAGVNMSF